MVRIPIIAVTGTNGKQQQQGLQHIFAKVQAKKLAIQQAMVCIFKIN